VESIRGGVGTDGKSSCDLGSTGEKTRIQEMPHISSTSNTSAIPRDVSVSAVSGRNVT
jgi:hypothetical protein